MTHLTSKPSVLSGLLLGMLLASAGALAHDTWILPTAFNGPAGQPVKARMSAGDGLKAEAAPRRQRLISVELLDANARKTYTDWADDAKQVQMSFAAPAPGVACLAVSTKDREIAIEPKLVDQYLAEIQPAAAVHAAWARQRAAGTTWKENYAKDAKTYLRTGTGDAGWPKLAVLGQTLEIVPQKDPTRMKKGDRLDVVLQHKGQPLHDVALRLFTGTQPERVVRTDAQGRASFDIAHTGAHLIATTMLNMPVKDGAPWTSRFATMGFGVAE